MSHNSIWKAWASWSLLLLFIGGLTWYGIFSNPPGDETKPQSYAIFPAMHDDAAGKVEKANKADLAKANPALASPFEGTARDPALSRITGRWVGVIDLGGSNRLQFSFNLREQNGQLSGTATFPIGEGSIVDGKINADQVSFTARHIAPSTGNPVLTRFSGTVSDRGLKLTMLSEGGESYLKLDPVSR